MRAATLTLLGLLCAGTASALPILPPQPAANCVLEAITVEHPRLPDPGWKWLQELLGLSDAEIEERKAADKLHEPQPEEPVYRWNCPLGCHPGQPGAPQIPQGGGGQPGSSNNVPEPTVGLLLLLGGTARAIYRRSAPRRKG